MAGPVEQLVQGDEVRPLDVPVGVFGLRLQVDAVGQASDEQFDGLDAGGLGEAVLRLEHGGLQVEEIFSIRQRWAMWCTARTQEVAFLANHVNGGYLRHYERCHPNLVRHRCHREGVRLADAAVGIGGRDRDGVVAGGGGGPGDLAGVLRAQRRNGHPRRR